MLYEKIIAGVLALCICGGAFAPLGNYNSKLSSFVAAAADYTEGTYENLTYCKYSDHVMITGCDENAEGEIVIPDKIEGAPVTKIGSGAFFCCLSITSIDIPDSVTEIEDDAFWMCFRLTSINIPDSVTQIGGGAFYLCLSLTSITVSEENEYFSSLDGILFDKNKTTLIKYPSRRNDEKYNIPDSVTTIGENAFGDCTSLTSITIPDSVTEIGDGAFNGCENMTSLTIPDSVTDIGNSAFFGCSSLISITVSKENEYFSNLDGILFDKNQTALIAYPSGKKDENYNIPDGVTEIGEYAFSGCESLTSITIPDSVTEIGEFAFVNCARLTSITIPDSVIEIGYYAFSHCTNLTSITIENHDCNIYDDESTICNGLDEKTFKDYFNGTIYGYENSTAQAYAEKYGYKFALIGSEPDVTDPPTEKIFYGDANCDGKVSIADSTAILQHLGNEDKYGLSDKGKLNADVDGVKGVTGNDAIMIQMVDAKLISVDELGAKKN